MAEGQDAIHNDISLPENDTKKMILELQLLLTSVKTSCDFKDDIK